MKTKLLAIVSALALGVGGITGCSTTTTAARGSDRSPSDMASTPT